MDMRGEDTNTCRPQVKAYRHTQGGGGGSGGTSTENTMDKIETSSPYRDVPERGDIQLAHKNYFRGE